MLDEIQRSSFKERGRRLRILRKMSGLTLEELSSKYNFGVSTIKYWECAKNNGLSSKGAKKIILAMQREGIYCSYMWLIYGVGLPPQFLDVHYYRGAKVSNEIEEIKQSAYEDEKSIEHEIAGFCKNIPNAIALTIFDDGMEPLYSIGDSIGGRRLYHDDLTKTVDKNCVVETADHQLLCRRVAQGGDPGNFNLYCINPSTLSNPPHLYEVKLLSAAPISRVWKRMVV